MPMSREKVAVGLSGGVDSAVSAYLLKREGYDVVGVHLVCWDEGPGCKASRDRQDALKVAMALEIPFEVLDFQKEYKERVIDRFYDDYAKGLTPNPDVWCNSEIKFGMFLEWAISEGFDKIATGHYAEVRKVEEEDQTRWGLFMPKDKWKDQTYFLYRLGQEELGRAMFPLGSYEKKEVRKIASEVGLPVADKKDSQGICFVGDVDISEFLHRRLQDNEGEVVDTSGRVVGKHRGVWFYTIGQRGGWQVSANFQKKFGGEIPVFYVVDKDVKNNRLVVGFGAETYRESLMVSDLSWVGSKRVNEDGFRTRIRHGGCLIGARGEWSGEKMRVELDEPQRGVAAGQAAVFYEGDELLGGGVIG